MLLKRLNGRLFSRPTFATNVVPLATTSIFKKPVWNPLRVVASLNRQFGTAEAVVIDGNETRNPYSPNIVVQLFVPEKYVPSVSKTFFLICVWFPVLEVDGQFWILLRLWYDFPNISII